MRMTLNDSTYHKISPPQVTKAASRTSPRRYYQVWAWVCSSSKWCHQDQKIVMILMAVDPLHGALETLKLFKTNLTRTILMTNIKLSRKIMTRFLRTNWRVKIRSDCKMNLINCNLLEDLKQQLNPREVRPSLLRARISKTTSTTRSFYSKRVLKEAISVLKACWIKIYSCFSSSS